MTYNTCPERERNLIADILAKMASDKEVDVQVFAEAPSKLLAVLQFDRANGFCDG